MDILSRLRKVKIEDRAGAVNGDAGRDALEEFIKSGVKFASSSPKIEDAYYRAVGGLMNCVLPSPAGRSMLSSGAIFSGCWLESSGSIGAEILSRFCPETAQMVFELFADYQRKDGLLPYKVTKSGPGFRQIQIVTPLARSVWNHYALTGNKVFLEKMFHAICRNDSWLEANRNTRGTGCVETFSAFDTGSDNSPRFWHIPDMPYMSDPTLYDPDSPLLPLLSPDMTANVYCQRKYLQKIARELKCGDDTLWERKAEESLRSLMAYCYDEKDQFFYDRDRQDRFVRVQSNNLLHVLACEVGDDKMFAEALSGYLLNTKKYFSRYPVTTLAMDDPRFFNLSDYNSWTGQVVMLDQIRLPPAFEYHHRYVELTWILKPILSALSKTGKFSWSINPWIGCDGFSEGSVHSFLCLLDYLERFSGIYPAPERELWFTALVPWDTDYGQTAEGETAYGRTVEENCFEFVSGKELALVYKNGELVFSFPSGARLITGRDGELKGITGMTVRKLKGEIVYRNRKIPFTVEGNERLAFTGQDFTVIEKPGIIPPNYGT